MSSSYLDYFAKAIENITIADVIRVLKEDFATSDEIASLYIGQNRVNIREQIAYSIVKEITANHRKEVTGIGIRDLERLLEELRRYTTYCSNSYFNDVTVYEVPDIQSIVAKKAILGEHELVSSLKDTSSFKDNQGNYKCAAYYDRGCSIIMYTTKMNDIFGTTKYYGKTLAESLRYLRHSRKQYNKHIVNGNTTIVKLDGTKHEYYDILEEEEKYREELRISLIKKVTSLYNELHINSLNKLLIFLTGLMNNKVVDVNKLSPQQRKEIWQKIEKQAIYDYIIYITRLYDEQKGNIIAFAQDNEIIDKIKLGYNKDDNGYRLDEFTMLYYKKIPTELIHQVAQALERNNNWFRYVIVDENGGIRKW